MPTQSTRIKQIFAIVFSVLLMFSSCIVANADINDSISICYAEINSRDVNLTISGIKATCKASLFARQAYEACRNLRILLSDNLCTVRRVPAGSNLCKSQHHEHCEQHIRLLLYR